MRIGIDARELSKGQPGGFRSYLSGLIGGLAKIDTVNEYVFFVESHLPQGQSLPPNSSFHIVKGHRLVADRLPMQRAIRQARLDVMHFPCNYGLRAGRLPIVITLHDCISLDMPVRSGALKHRILTLYNSHMTRRSVPNAERIITISDYSLGKILGHFDIREKCRVVYQGVPTTRQIPESGSLLGKSQYMLATASPDPRKNIGSVVEAFAYSRAQNNGCRLVVVASHPDAVGIILSTAADLGIRESVVVRTGVSDTDLLRLYQHSICYVFPSLEEGFGLTPLEAMSCGCPVISSNASVMPEILGDAVLYFDPHSPRDQARKMDTVWEDAYLRESLRHRGYAQARRYSWTNTAARTLEIYREAAESQRAGESESVR